MLASDNCPRVNDEKDDVIFSILDSTVFSYFLTDIVDLTQKIPRLEELLKDPTPERYNQMIREFYKLLRQKITSTEVVMGDRPSPKDLFERKTMTFLENKSLLPELVDDFLHGRTRYYKPNYVKWFEPREKDLLRKLRAIEYDTSRPNPGARLSERPGGVA